MNGVLLYSMHSSRFLWPSRKTSSNKNLKMNERQCINFVLTEPRGHGTCFGNLFVIYLIEMHEYSKTILKKSSEMSFGRGEEGG